ncbi:MAG TPA: hypothetical protein VN672_01375 [Solirubrobacteraceae bacterium]|nr:hypothetical protein [Solirubrobacteraceae bacterium]
MNGREMADADVSRAAERLRLACRALSAAARDLHVAQKRDATGVAVTAEELDGETERVCEMAEEVSEAARKLGRFAPA